VLRLISIIATIFRILQLLSPTIYSCCITVLHSIYYVINITIHNQLHELQVRTFAKNMMHFCSTILILVFAVHQYTKYLSVSKMHQYNFHMFSTFLLPVHFLIS